MTSCKEPALDLPTILDDLDQLQFQMACALNALDAIYDAMTCGSYSPKNYMDGLFGITDHLHYLNQEIKDKLAEVRAARKANTAT